jgi:hypothetical protein
MNKVYKVYWKREVYFSADVVFNDKYDPRILADAHARTGELAMVCHSKVNIDSREEEVYCLIDEESGKKWI